MLLATGPTDIPGEGTTYWGSLLGVLRTHVKKLNIAYHSRSPADPSPPPLRGKIHAGLGWAHESQLLNFQDFCGLAVKHRHYQKLNYITLQWNQFHETKPQKSLLPNYCTTIYACEVIYIYGIHMLEILSNPAFRHSMLVQVLHVGRLKSDIRKIFILWESENTTYNSELDGQICPLLAKNYFYIFKGW